MVKQTKRSALRLKPRQSEKRHTDSRSRSPGIATDIEKEASEREGYEDWKTDEEEDLDSDLSPSESSSRFTTRSHDPILGRRSKPARAPARAYATDMLPRRRFNRYFTIVLASFLLLFILVLIRNAIHSTNSIFHRNNPLPPKPPPWEDFPYIKRYFGGVRALVSRAKNEPVYPKKTDRVQSILGEDVEQTKGTALGSKRRRDSEDHHLPNMKPYNPVHPESSGYARVEECFLDAESKIHIPKLHVFEGIPSGFPNNVLGSYDIFGIEPGVCFDRFGKLGPYGLGYSTKRGGTGACMEGDVEGRDQIWTNNNQVDFRGIKWASVQERCAEKNKHRFREWPTLQNREADHLSLGDRALRMLASSKSDDSKSKLLPRTAVLIRTWHDYVYDPEDIMNLRAIINELSLASGTEYVVHFLIHVKDHGIQIWADEELHQRILNEALPEEFRGMGTLWSERQMEMIYDMLQETNYRDLPVHGNYRSTFLPVQYFASKHPEYDYIWHWELDIRYTGHMYEMMDRVGKWAKQQPRKYLWERNGRFYVPSEHGSYEDFKHLVRIQVEQGANQNVDGAGKGLGQSAKAHEKPIWGPEIPYQVPGNELVQIKLVDPEANMQPPTTMENDNYEWGVGEDADLITFNPLFNPDQTGWLLAEDVTGYNLSCPDCPPTEPTIRKPEPPPPKRYPPRRTAIVTASRLSRRLLMLMHRETAFRRHTMFSEMWPASCALHHGLKAVYAPHPEYIDRRWPTDYLAAIYNGGRNGASGGAWSSVFTDEHQHNFLGVSWYYHAGFPQNLWKRWLGYRVDNDGGEEEELANEGRMCLPSMLLHPVKQVDLIFEKPGDGPKPGEREMGGDRHF